MSDTDTTDRSIGRASSVEESTAVPSEILQAFDIGPVSHLRSTKSAESGFGESGPICRLCGCRIKEEYQRCAALDTGVCEP